MPSIEEAREAYNKAELALTQLVREECVGPHEPKQHRDRKPPWCHTCGRTDRGEQIKEPQSPKGPTCGSCGRTRTVGDPEHPMDAYDYSPLQAVTGQPFGWYSGSDGEICPEDMTKMIRQQ